ncbi:ATP-binding protein [Nesterenkonia sp. MY13]|uniref:ATP-binding protein n=1 Tax=Nesterenkonia sedimenti TaxID=1463632 RepID=A0A7X8TLX8_9MICC|nr:ATP-binding protein [Nesterenkonia sedimenti]
MLSGSSPYSTGGGGVSFAHSVATVYLASILTGSRRPELSELPVRRIAFQTGPEHPVDDLLVTGGDDASEVTLAVACRATPNFVQSDDGTVKLVGSLLAEVEKFNSDTHLVAVAAAGHAKQWDELAMLSDIARAHADAPAFEASTNVDGRWATPVRSRFSQFQAMVRKARGSDVSDAEVAHLTWRLLRRFRMLTFAVQTPDERDRTAVATDLDPVTNSGANGVALRDRLGIEAARYDRVGAVVDRDVLRRDVHRLLNVARTRSSAAWKVMEGNRQLALDGLRASIGDNAAGSSLELSFTDRRERLREALLAAGADGGSPLLVHGQSGTGKSAMTISTVAELEAEHRGGFEAVILNFKNLPHSTFELHTALGLSVQELLTELSAHLRVLVIDAADAALERSAPLLSDLIVSAKSAGVGVVAISSDVASEFVSEQLRTGFGRSVVPFEVELLGDDDIEIVAENFALIRPVLRDLPKNSLLRRPVVLDLLARTGVRLNGTLSEWECMNLVWANVGRGENRPSAGSAQAREQTLLAAAATVMQLPPELRPVAGTDAEAVDQLRRDHLLAPANPYQEQLEFAHDEVRRYATTILLVRAQDLIQVLEAAGAPRWALSAATLACNGLLKDPRVRPEQRFLDFIAGFRAFAGKHGARWADVPVEAVLETPMAYECLKAGIADAGSNLELADVVRIVGQRHRAGGLIDTDVAGAVVRFLLDHEEPWNISEDSFELLADWLQALVFADAAEGNELRVALRARVLKYWKACPPLKPRPEDDIPGAVRFGGFSTPRRSRRRRKLDYQLTRANFVETLALLGKDLNDEAEACLRDLAEDAPSFLAPAVDSPLSARAIAQRDPNLLATLMESYYIEDELHSFHDEGVRRHDGRWTSVGGPFSMFYFGGFWSLCHYADPTTLVRVMNNILNSGANARVRTISRLTSPDQFALQVDKNGQVAGTDEGNEDEERGCVLNIDGTRRLYVGDSHVWSWYRGTSVGPYAATSALQAMERVIEMWLEHGIPARRVVDLVLEGCENLAMPGMLYGVLVRHIDVVGDALDSFLAEPDVWTLEFARATQERNGLAASTEGLKNLNRRQWTPRDVAFFMITHCGAERIEALKTVGEQLIETGDLLRFDPGLTRGWAASLDADQYKRTSVPEGVLVEVEPPPELLAVQQANAAYQRTVNNIVGLQNRYWGSGTRDVDGVPLASEEIAADLETCHALLQSEEEFEAIGLTDAVAHVIRAAVERAAAGDLDALGDYAALAIQFVLELASSFSDVENQGDDGQYFDLGADRAVAHALPAFLTPELAAALNSAAGSVRDVVDAGFAIAGNAPQETRLFLARGCDVIWSSPCNGDPCMHQTALDWLLETARNAEIGPWNESGHGRQLAPIEGDIVTRLEDLPGGRVYIKVLDPAIRGLGAAQATQHCRTAAAASFLATLLDVQGRALVAHAQQGVGADDRGTHTLVAARALLKVYAKGCDSSPVLAQLDILSVEASSMLNFLHGLAAAGAENEDLANAARRIWPTVLRHGITYHHDDVSPYAHHHWGDWAAAALLPDPLPWASGLQNEVTRKAIDWVCAEDLLDLVESWLPLGRGKARCVEALVRLLKRLPINVQVTRGIAWVANLCIQSGRVTVRQPWLLNDWLKETRNAAEELGRLGDWQMLVDSLVVAGNRSLAPYSR